MDSSTAIVVRSGPEEDDGGDTSRGGTRKDLSEDEIVEILARLPVKSLMRFRSVSKLWYSLIVSPNFVAVHSTHNHNKNVTLSLSSCEHFCTDDDDDDDTSAGSHSKTTLSFQFGDVTDTEKLDFSLPLHSVEMVGCFNGVVCLSLSPRPRNYALWNPATRQVRDIGGAMMGEDPDDVESDDDLEDLSHIICGWYGSGFCFDLVTNAFKVTQIKLTVTEAETTAQVDVFSTTTNSWTEKNINVPYEIRGSCFNIIRGATCVDRYMHWHIATSHGDDADDMYILSYDMIDEVFKRIEMPSVPDPVFVSYPLAPCRGSLAIFVHRNRGTGSDRSYNEVDVWVMNDNGGSDQSWSKLLTCKPSIKITRALRFFRKDEVDLILLWNESDLSVYLYDPESEETKKFWISRPMSESFLYNESLVSLG